MQSTQASSAVFEAKKVEEIKLAISEGRFQVNSEKVADGLLETVKDLLSARNADSIMTTSAGQQTLKQSLAGAVSHARVTSETA
jgi:hypothetical protein